MIIGTAGHIDHGKTTLVGALTGVNTDRLKEEQTRGISIELGYAYTPLDNGDILGFIDVPGHERLIHTMTAGASGIDFGLLVVAADDGIMPQTHEHLAILSLLGVAQGALAITKADRADPDQLQTVQQDLQQLVAGSALQDAPVFVVSATTANDPGLQALRTYLHGSAQAMAARHTDGLFRLAIDRAFTLKGHGTVVTGTVHDGVFDLNQADQDLRLMPGGQKLRVRSIHAQNQAATQARAGQRCALNLAGIAKDTITRGDWVADARCFVPSRNIDVQCQLLPQASSDVRTWTPVHVHLGAAHLLAHAVPLSDTALSAGQTGWVQLVFDQAVCAMPGDRFIVRDAQARHTLGGGIVLDPNAPQRKRRSPERLAWLHAVAQVQHDGDLLKLLQQAPWGLDEHQVMRLMRKTLDTLPELTGADWLAPRSGHLPRTLIWHAHRDALIGQVLQALSHFHQQWPDEAGIDIARLRRISLPTLPEPLWQALCEYLLDQHLLARNGPWLHLPEHAVALNPSELALAERLLPLVQAGGIDPPWVRDLAAQLDLDEADVRHTLLKLLRRGDLYQVVRDLFYHRDVIAQLATHLRHLAATQGVTAAQFRDHIHLGRKRSIQILEFFNRAGLTRRVRDTHILRKDSVEF